MSSRSIVSSGPSERHRRLRAAAVAVIALAVTGCSINRAGVTATYRVWWGFATIQEEPAPGATPAPPVVVAWDDLVFTGDAPHPILEMDGTVGGLTAEERVRSEWRKYVRRRLETATSPEFRARFGNGPRWCLLDDQVHWTRFMSRRAGTAEAGLELQACTGPLAAPAGLCANPPGITPILSVHPRTVNFGDAPAGGTGASVVMTVGNIGTGRLCAYPPVVAGEYHPRDFLADASDCLPRTPDEVRTGRVFLDSGGRSSCQVRVTFRPTDPGRRSSSMRVSSTDAARPLAHVPLEGDGLRGALRNPGLVCVNEAIPGTSCHRGAFLLHNDGPGEVRVWSVAPPAADAAVWSVEPLTLPYTIAAGGDMPIGVRTCGATTNTTLIVGSNSNERGGPPLEVEVRSPSVPCP